MLVAETGGVTSLAAVIKRSPSQVSQWLNASPDSKTQKPRAMSTASARYIEEQCGRLFGWMDQPIDAQEEDLRPGRHLANVEPGPAIRGEVPLISWVQAGAWSEIVDNFAPGDAEEWLPCPKKFGPHAFALRVRGLSMEPRYQSGDIIFVDPDAGAEHGKHVVVRLDDEHEATFKQLVVEGGQRFLRALNPDWPGPKLIPIEGNATICGVVIGKWVPE